MKYIKIETELLLPNTKYVIVENTGILLNIKDSDYLIGNFDVTGNPDVFYKEIDFFDLYFTRNGLTHWGDCKRIGTYKTLESAKLAAQNIDNAIEESLKNSEQIFITEVETPTEYWGEGQRDCKTGQLVAAH